MLNVTDEVRRLIAAERPQAMSSIRIEAGGIGIALVNGGLRHLNATAAEIYRLADGRRTIDEIADALQVTYPDVDREQLFEDALETVRQFQYAGMICTRTAA
jgi:hypothetical protein